MIKTNSNYLDNEERKLIKSLETDGWNPSKDRESWKTLLSKTAANTLTKDQRMNIRITRNDLEGIKIKAVEEGIPYQTLVASIIHKYVTGKLTEKRKGGHTTVSAT
jgi:predicted DNA binding CopG/RHH family protein